MYHKDRTAQRTQPPKHHILYRYVRVYYCCVLVFLLSSLIILSRSSFFFSQVRVVSNNQTNFSKKCYFSKKKLTTLPKKMTKPSMAKRCIFGKVLETFGKFSHITPSDFIQTAQSSSSREPTARRRSLWSKCWRRKDSRHSPCTSEVGSPSSPVKFAREKLGRLLFAMML